MFNFQWMESDKLITEQSHFFLSRLLPGDLVLADRGFKVRVSIHSYPAELKMPAITRGKKQCDPADLHIERDIGVLC